MKKWKLAQQKNEIEELKEFLSVTGRREEKENVAIIFDGKQYSVRIPKKFVDAAEIDRKSDTFAFQLLLSSPAKGEAPKLTAELIRG